MNSEFFHQPPVPLAPEKKEPNEVNHDELLLQSLIESNALIPLQDLVSELIHADPSEISCSTLVDFQM